MGGMENEKPMTRAEIEALVQEEVKKQVDEAIQQLRDEIPGIVSKATAQRGRGFTST